ncbi:hypothetical protein RBB50_004850 [Rhinocladiella similis]
MALQNAGEDDLEKSVAFVSEDDDLAETCRFSERRREEFLTFTSKSNITLADSLNPSSSSTNTLSSFEVLQHWLEDCTQNHASCRSQSPAGPPCIPTRLIDIGPGKGVICPVLCLGRNLPPSTRYATLSHSWGEREIYRNFLRLRSSNFDELTRRIPLSLLSKTTRDALEVISRLGLRYLWIDSLCIFQDSDEDWMKESALVGGFYRHAYINIAATAAQNGTQGLFRRRSLLDVEPCCVQTRWIGQRNGRYFCFAIGGWQRDVDAQPLLSRAWVTQEITLAPRVVHFSGVELYWECEQKRACESFPDGIPNFTAEKLTMSRPPQVPSWIKINDDNFPLHEIWTTIVNAYSRASLTYPDKDKLIAISGIARILGMSADQYLAGLWKNGLVEQLLWVVATEAEPGAVRTSEYRAPSWSWASIDGEVHLETPTLQRLQEAMVEVLDADTTPLVRDDRFGLIESGTIRLKGILAHAQVSEQTVTINTRSAFINGEIVQLPTPPKLMTRHFLGTTHANIVLDRMALSPGDYFHCLLFSHRRGLLLRPTFKKRGQFQRCGFFAILVDLNPEEPGCFLDLCRATYLDESLYEAKADVISDGLQRYIIELV